MMATKRAQAEAVLLTPGQVAEMTGLSRSATYRRLDAGDFGPVIRIGGSVRITRRSFDRWLRAQDRLAAEIEDAVVYINQRQRRA